MINGQVTIKNVDFTQKGDKIYISYDIKGQGKANLDAYYSINDGATWHGPVKHISGDVKGVRSGTGKQITWNVLEDRDWLIAENLKIKLKAELKEGTFTDSRDGKTYKWVRIGDQVWMAENLNYDAGSGCWCYDDNSRNCDQYGRLYNWETAKGACPDGWHLPSKSEFETLLSRYGGEGEQAYTALISGGSSGFSALLGGFRYGIGKFSSLGRFGIFWSSSEGFSVRAWRLSMRSFSKSASVGRYDKSWGFSVRCLQD
jgi:uncharacterized protein (TIGR02145 family)